MCRGSSMFAVIPAINGGKDPGAVGIVTEKHINLDVAASFKERLLYWGLDTTLTRDGDYTVEVADRCFIANSSKAKVFISIHSNAGGGTGFESYRLPGSVEGEKLQACIHKALTPLLAAFVAESQILTATALEAEPVEIPMTLSDGELEAWIRDRGPKATRWYVLANTKMPGVLVENLFVDHPEDARLLQNPAFLRQLGYVLADGVADYLGVTSKPYHCSPKLKPVIEWARQVGLSAPAAGHDYTLPISEERFLAILQRLPGLFNLKGEIEWKPK